MNIISYNCNGINTDKNSGHLRPTIEELCDSYDVICLQETWLSKQELGSLNSMRNDFHSVGQARIDHVEGICANVRGGVAILWHTKFTEYISPIKYEHDWIVGIEIMVDNKKCVILCVYMPYQKYEYEDMYLQNLGALAAILADLEHTCYAICGDWNCDPVKGSLFAEHLKSFAEDNNLILSNINRLPNDSFTYISDASHTTTWLDHFLCSMDFDCMIQEMKILYDTTARDHIPVLCNIDIESAPELSSDIIDCEPKLNWSRLDSESLSEYKVNSGKLLDEIVIPNDCCLCQDMNCRDKNHIESMCEFTDSICQTLITSGQMVFKNRGSKQYKCRPGWNDYAKEAHDYARECFLIWKENGKPRQGPVFDLYKRSKSRCKLAMRFIKRHENKLRKDAIAKKYMQLDKQAFWKEVKTMNAVNTALPNNIEDARGSNEIVDLWKKHYIDLFNCLKKLNHDVNVTVNDCFDDVRISPQDIQEALKDLDKNKSCGSDGIYAEHLKYADIKLITLLSMNFTCMLVHGVIPESLIDVILIPVIKDKCGKISSKDNYRPIALASILSKVLEIILLNRMYVYIDTKPNQFGFKKKHSTDMCIYTMKESIERYKRLGSCMYLCFIDASKAFDRVNHDVLFNTLVDRGVPGYIIRILAYWYKNQTMCVRWGGLCSGKFYVSNGVRQGGILSPYLFSLYMDDMSVNLQKCKTGCMVGDMMLNHLMYADDLVIFSPSASGLRDLLSICSKYGVSHDIKYNPKKSVCMIVRGHNRVSEAKPVFLLNEVRLECVDTVKYLGQIITDDWMDDADIQRQKRKIYAQGNTLIRKFYMCSLNVKIQLFRSYCTSFYCSHLWWNHKQSVMKRLVIAHNDVFRILLSLPRRTSASQLFVSHNVPSCNMILRKQVYGFSNRLDMSSNAIIQSMLGSCYTFESQLRKHWRYMLYVGLEN